MVKKLDAKAGKGSGKKLQKLYSNSAVANPSVAAAAGSSTDGVKNDNEKRAPAEELAKLTQREQELVWELNEVRKRKKAVEHDLHVIEPEVSWHRARQAIHKGRQPVPRTVTRHENSEKMDALKTQIIHKKCVFLSFFVHNCFDFFFSDPKV